ncbi:EamA family transporter [Alkalihalobacillus deserti]|uniref:EamA family transporter n=1 Tax=Alkalihalobacillus deserti TaxID=2879466 RepID=UPI001D15BF46|nr:EamA family transporter [Alkalihalobacillus deserti]
MYFAENKFTSLQLGNASSVASMMYLELAIAILVAWFWLSEWTTTFALIGGMIALLGVIIVNGLGRKNQKTKKRTSVKTEVITIC